MKRNKFYLSYDIKITLKLHLRLRTKLDWSFCMQLCYGLMEKLNNVTYLKYVNHQWFIGFNTCYYISPGRDYI